MTERVAVMYGYEGPPASVDAGKVDDIKALYTQAVYTDDWDAVEAYDRVLCLLHDMPFDPARRMVVVLSEPDEPTSPEQRWGDEPLTERFPEPHPYRILVTGSRDWDDWGTLCQALDSELVRLRLLTDTNSLPRRVTIVHGGCPTGADAMAGQWVARHRGEGIIANTEIHPAEWKLHGRFAGPKRNDQMVKSGADVCMAFIKNNSRGASGCLAMAKKAGIPTQVYRA